MASVLTTHRYSGGHSGDGHAYTTRRPDSDDILPSADDAASRAASREWQPVYDNPEPSGHFLPARYRPESDGESDAGEEIASRRKRGKKPLSARKKAERVRMLEKAFGPSSRSVAPTRLAPRGTKKRLAVRCVQILLTFAIVLGSLGGVFARPFLHLDQRMLRQNSSLTRLRSRHQPAKSRPGFSTCFRSYRCCRHSGCMASAAAAHPNPLLSHQRMGASSL